MGIYVATKCFTVLASSKDLVHSCTSLNTYIILKCSYIAVSVFRHWRVAVPHIPNPHWSMIPHCVYRSYGYYTVNMLNMLNQWDVVYKSIDTVRGLWLESELSL